tara:strand:- start:156 stop:329 length:174 start_codon:yes stop_codon:yes gene_type:complete
MSIEPSPFLPQTTIAIEKVKIAANEAQPKVKIMNALVFIDYILLERYHLFSITKRWE